jgi:hypothetical protein
LPHRLNRAARRLKAQNPNPNRMDREPVSRILVEPAGQRAVGPVADADPACFARP